jgi:hypothetical protein
LAATCKKVPHHAAVARCKGNIFKKIWIQESYGPWRDLAIAGRKMTHCEKWHSTRDKGFEDVVMKDGLSNWDDGKLVPGKDEHSDN